MLADSYSTHASSLQINSFLTLDHLPTHTVGTMRPGERRWLLPDGTLRCALSHRAASADTLGMLLSWCSEAEVLREAAAAARAHALPLVVICTTEAATQAYVYGADHVVSPESTIRDCMVRAQAFVRRFRGSPDGPALGSQAHGFHTPGSHVSSSSGAAEAAKIPSEVLSIGPLRLEWALKAASVSGEPLKLSPKEFALLWCLVEGTGQTVSRAQLLEQVWNLSFDPGTNRLEFYVHRLRRRLEARGLTGMIRSVRGAGYEAVPPETPPESVPLSQEFVQPAVLPGGIHVWN